MNSLNERIKELRKRYELSQKEFAAKIGISQRSVSWSEQSGNNVPDSTIKSLCMAFNVREDWLRNGTLPMLDETPTSTMEKLKKDFNLDDYSYSLIYEYLKLDIEKRNVILDYLRNVQDNIQTQKNDGLPKMPEVLESEFPPEVPEDKLTPDDKEDREIG